MSSEGDESEVEGGENMLYDILVYHEWGRQPVGGQDTSP